MAASVCMQNCTDGSGGFLREIVTDEIWTAWTAAAEYFDYSPWLLSLLGSTMIGLTGIFPLFIIPIEEGADLKTGASAGTLRILLSFAVGGLLGDVFLHLLPEAWENESFKGATDAGHPSMKCGLWVLSGFLVFIIVEKIFALENENENEIEESEPSSTSGNSNDETLEKEMENNNCITLVGENPKNGFSKHYTKSEFSETMSELQPFLERKPTKNGYSHLPNGYKDSPKNGFVNNGIKPVLMCNEFSNVALGGLSIDEAKDRLKNLTKSNGFTVETSSADRCSGDKKLIASTGGKVVKEKSKHITGYLNLMANIIDNFTHGLAVGGSFLVSFRLGALTTFAILVHEIPHEVGDFAILLRSGFNRWDAARAQLVTASGGIFGAMSAVFFSGGVGSKTSWILPFTAGGFLHIGMVTILPELLKESNPKESLKQLGALILGIIVMAFLTILCD